MFLDSIDIQPDRKVSVTFCYLITPLCASRVFPVAKTYFVRTKSKSFFSLGSRELPYSFRQTDKQSFDEDSHQFTVPSGYFDAKILLYNFLVPFFRFLILLVYFSLCQRLVRTSNSSPSHSNNERSNCANLISCKMFTPSPQVATRKIHESPSFSLFRSVSTSTSFFFEFRRVGKLLYWRNLAWRREWLARALARIASFFTS